MMNIIFRCDWFWSKEPDYARCIVQNRLLKRIKKNKPKGRLIFMEVYNILLLDWCNELHDNLQKKLILANF